MSTTKTQRHKSAAGDNPESRIQMPECRNAESPRHRVNKSPRLAFQGEVT